MGSFRLVTGNLHLHRYYDFTGSLAETAPKSLRLSCGSEFTSPCGFAETCVFAKQSLGPFHCGPLVLFTLPGHPFSRSYGVILPSSLARVFPRVLGFSPRLPVSVCGTGTYFLARSFSWQCRIGDFGTKISLAITLQPYDERICLLISLHA
jgi:hypothetical protein